VAAHVWGVRVFADRPDAHVPFPPLVAQWRPAFDLWAVVPAAAALVAVVLGPRLSARLSWRALLVVAFVAAAAWAVALALADGPRGITAPLSYPADYGNDVARVHGIGAFLRGFVPNIGSFAQHVRAHPPGMVVLLAFLDRLGLGGRGWEAGLVIAGGAAAVPAALIALRDVSDEASARVAAPFLALAPAAIYVATSADALFMGVLAWAAALLILSTSRSGRGADALALGGGVLFGAASMLSYGAVLAVLIPLPVSVARRRMRPLVLAGIGWLAVIGAFAAAGFWWVAGLRATTAQYRHSVARVRPQAYFWFGDLAALAVVLGPAAFAGLAELRDRWIWLLVGGALVAVVVADASGFSRGEVERIWLPFVPWILVGCAALGARSPAPGGRARDDPVQASRAWLASNVALALALQLLFGTTW
jgi:hypothetical protein